MTVKIGIRREEKNRWERRTPLIPAHVKQLIEQHGFQFIVQPSRIRYCSDQEYQEVGAIISDDLSPCDIILGVKEVPFDQILSNKVYLYFSHTIKCQPYNMPMLKKLLDSRCTLIDYELIRDANGKRMVFFGIHAGLAGMIDSLWALGQKLKLKGLSTPFEKIKLAHEYSSLERAKTAIAEIGEEIAAEGLPSEIVPLIFGITGYGHVSQGAQEILDLLPVKSINPEELDSLISGKPDRHVVYKTIFRQPQMVRHREHPDVFDKQHYYAHPEEYEPIFDNYWPKVSVLINGIYWEERFPRLVTKKSVKSLQGKSRLEVIGDLTCDINGSIELTYKPTEPDDPVYTYDPVSNQYHDGIEKAGIVILAVDNLPGEIAKEASEFFSNQLLPLIPRIATVDYSVSFEDLNLPPELKQAVIVYNGELTPSYRYLENCLRNI